MSFEFRLPELGEQIESGDVVRVLVSEGDQVEKEQIVLELETDKAVLDVPCPEAGVVKEVHVTAGDEVPIGGLILTLDTDGATAQKEPKIEPDPESDEKREAETESPDDDPGESTLNEYPPLQKEEAPPDKPEPKTPSKPAAEPSRAAPPAAGGTTSPTVAASPSVRRLAREVGVDLTQVQGSGPSGRISDADVKAAARARTQPASATSQSQAAAPQPSGPEPLDDAQFTKWGDIRRETMSRVRKTTARNLANAWSTIPHVTHFDQADITDIDEQRKRLAKEVEEAGGQLTVTAIVLKIVGLALREFPKFRASLDMAEQEVIYKEYIHIGVAVDTDRGLLVPVIRDVDQKSLVELAVELSQVSAAARTAKLSLDDMQGAVFSISNLGGIGGTNFNPIINPPEVAIMGVSRGQMQPVFKHGTFVPRLIMPFSVSYDHRLIDGADAARFCRWIANTIESPLRLLLHRGA